MVIADTLCLCAANMADLMLRLEGKFCAIAESAAAQAARIASANKGKPATPPKPLPKTPPKGLPKSLFNTPPKAIFHQPAGKGELAATVAVVVP